MDRCREQVAANDVSVTLVIAGKNAAPTLSSCLTAATTLLGQNGLREILFVDDGSQDSTADIVKRFPVRCLRGPNGGPGAARNVGWRVAMTPLVWFLDADCVVEPDTLRYLLRHISLERVAGVGGSYTNLCDDSLLARLIHAEIVCRHQRMPTEVNFLASFNVLYRREALECVGGFDEQSVNGPNSPGAEDADLAFRLANAGYRLRFERRSLVGHHHPTRLAAYLARQAGHGYFRSQLYLRHPGRALGDSYSSLWDHVQPPLAATILGLTPLVVLGSATAICVVAVLAAALAALQLPISLRIGRQNKSLDAVSFAALSFVRAFWRAGGMLLGACTSLPRAGNITATLARLTGFRGSFVFRRSGSA
jgi:GT2 family glycosyltransferase